MHAENQLSLRGARLPENTFCVLAIFPIEIYRKWGIFTVFDVLKGLNQFLNAIDRLYALNMTPLDPFQQFPF